MTFTGLELYNRTAVQAASVVIDKYSTSFALACSLLGKRVRQHIKNIYALVRVADEIVDGPAAQAGLAKEEIAKALAELEEQTLAALESGFSSNLVVHAFALTAKECFIGAELIKPFFASMRTDLKINQHDLQSLEEYIYGSAQVVGLMCLQAFINAGRAQKIPAPAILHRGAMSLGAAFQEINFLRDHQDDQERLQRDYLGVSNSAQAKTAAFERIEQNLLIASQTLELLPRDCAGAVAVALELYQELNDELKSADQRRARIKNHRKLKIAAKAYLAQRLKRSNS